MDERRTAPRIFPEGSVKTNVLRKCPFLTWRKLGAAARVNFFIVDLLILTMSVNQSGDRKVKFLWISEKDQPPMTTFIIHAKTRQSFTRSGQRFHSQVVFGLIACQ